MDRTTTKKNLRELLNDPQYSTIVLTGAWGAGKTHLWEELSKETNIKYCYFSLFGAKTVNQIKRGLALSPISVSAEDGEKIKSAWGKILQPLSKTLDGLTDGNGLVGAAANAVSDLAGDAIMARVLTETTIVLDDVERADSSLSIESIMGLIDELRRAKNKILIILNVEKLASSAASKWREFYEKSIDIELRLQTTPDDAFEAVKGSFDNYVAEARVAWLATGCNNIRIAQRLSRSINVFFGGRNLPSDLLSPLISDAVWLTFAQYDQFKSKVNARQFIEAIRNVRFGMSGKNTPEQAEIEKNNTTTLSYYYDFQDAFCDFIETGNINKQSVADLLDGLEESSKMGNIYSKLTNWIGAVYWHTDRTAQDLMEEAKALVPHACLLKPYDAQSFINGLVEIGATGLSEEFKKSWCDGVVSNKMQHNLTIGIPANFDSEILQAVDVANNAANPPPSLEESLGRVMSSGGWNPEHEQVINQTSQQSWEEFIKEDSGGKRIGLISKLMNQSYDKTKIGVSAARQACDSLVKQDPTGRLAQVLKARGLAT